jgi:hypothetical protein
MLTKKLHRLVIEIDHSPSLSLGGRSPDVNSGTIEVDVAPRKGKKLAKP